MFTQTKDFKKDLVGQVNPPKYEKAEDMSNLTYLNDASVLYNLKQRYYHKLIYVSDGMFGDRSVPAPHESVTAASRWAWSKHTDQLTNRQILQTK